jgi:hypothetical protein
MLYLLLLLVAPPVVGLLCSFVLYTVGLASRGKQSLAHALLFEHLRLLSPTTDSVALLAGVPTAVFNGTNVTHTTSQRHQQQQQSRPIPRTLDERLQALELSASTVSGGMVAVSVMKNTSDNTNNSQHQNQSMGWKTLEWTSALVMGCLVCLSLRYVYIVVKLIVGAMVFEEATFCCSGHQEGTSSSSCWERWSSAVQIHDTYKALIVMLAFFTWSSIAQLSRQTSSAYSAPASYVTAWIFALVTYFYLIPASSSSSFLNIEGALEEWAARLLLWIRLLGIRGDEIPALDDEATLQSKIDMLVGPAKLLLAVITGYLGFIVSEPISTTIHLILYQWYSHRAAKSKAPLPTTTEDDVDEPSPNTSSASAMSSSILKKRKLLLLGSATMLPIVSIIVSPDGSFRSSVTILSCWVFVAALFILANQLLQTHLDRALPAIKQVLDNGEAEISSDQILGPFTNRYKRLVDMGGNLLVLPSTLVVLLLLLATTTAMLPWSDISSSRALSSIGYHRGGPGVIVKTKDGRQLLVAAKRIDRRSIEGRNTLSGFLTDSDMMNCEEARNGASGVSLDRGLDLLKAFAPPSITVAGALSNLQQRAAKSKSGEKSSPPDDKGNRNNNNHNHNEDNAAGELQTILTMLIRHPFITATIARPILHLWIFLILGWWCLSLSHSFVFSRSIRNEIGTYSFAIQQSHKSR